MRPLIIANWKCNPPTRAEAKRNFNLMKKKIKKFKGEVVICPPFVYLPYLQASNLKLGAQDMFWQEGGAFTGEISPLMLKDLKCSYVILGHSERRIHLKETDEMINKKVKAALKAGLKIILCVGEKHKGKLKETQNQLEKDLKGVTKHDLKNIIPAYEPIWAISGFGGKAASSEEAAKGALLIRKTLSRIGGKTQAKKTKILYGGSASKNPRVYIYDAKLDGLVIGSTSSKARDFIKLLEDLK